MNHAIHAQIIADAASAKAQAKQKGPVPYAEFETLKGLVDSATDAILKSLPVTFEHHGKTYRLATQIQLARVAVFKDATADTSMLVVSVGTPDDATPAR